MWERKWEKQRPGKKRRRKCRGGGEKDQGWSLFFPFILQSSLECYPVFAWRLIHIKMQNSKAVSYNVSSGRLVECLDYLLFSKEGKFSDNSHTWPFRMTPAGDNPWRQDSYRQPLSWELRVIHQVHMSGYGGTLAINFHVFKLQDWEPAPPLVDLEDRIQKMWYGSTFFSALSCQLSSWSWGEHQCFPLCDQEIQCCSCVTQHGISKICHISDHGWRASRPSTAKKGCVFMGWVEREEGVPWKKVVRHVICHWYCLETEIQNTTFLWISSFLSVLISVFFANYSFSTLIINFGV